LTSLILIGAALGREIEYLDTSLLWFAIHDEDSFRFEIVFADV